jgi:hypothetical protein
VNYPSWLALGTGTLFLVTGPVCGQTGRTRGPEQILGIHLYDQAQVPAGVLHSATVEAARLFRAAGIRISWEQTLVEAPEDRGLDMSARKSVPFWPPDHRSYLVARLVRGMPASALPGALGFALPWARGGAQVTIFYDRVEALTPSVPTASYIILGHALAHEIGHVLLGSSEHAHDGLMQARWNPASWRLASAGLLAFRPAEATGMRAKSFHIVGRTLRQGVSLF